MLFHDDVIKWKHFPRYWPFVRGIHRSPMNSPQKGQGHGAMVFSLICAQLNGWVNTREAGNVRCYRTHCDVILMLIVLQTYLCQTEGPSRHVRWWPLHIINIADALSRSVSFALYLNLTFTTHIHHIQFRNFVVTVVNVNAPCLNL